MSTPANPWLDLVNTLKAGLTTYSNDTTTLATDQAELAQIQAKVDTDTQAIAADVKGINDTCDALSAAILALKIQQ